MYKVILSIFLFLSIPSFVMAQVVINEIAWMGSSIENVEPSQFWRYEWIELYNSGGVTSLDGWSIELYREELDFRIPLKGTIESDDYFVIAASDKIEGFDINYSNLGGKFFNGGQRVILKDGTGTLVEEVDMREGWIAGKNNSKKTMERRDVDSWGSSVFVGGTPGEVNSIFGKEEGEVESVFLTESKKEPSDSSSGSTQVVLAASVVALGSVLAVLALRKRLQSRA